MQGHNLYRIYVPVTMIALHLSMLCQPLVTAFCLQFSYQCQCTVMSRLGITVVCTHVIFRKPILGDSHVTLLPHPLLHLITHADGKAKSFKARGSEWGNSCQMDMLMCIRGQKMLHLSGMRADETGTLCADSCCDWNPIA